MSVEESAARANAIAGGAVVFAGMTVVIALASLIVVGVPFLTTMGLAAAGTVFVAVAIAVTLMPALLGAIGHHIDRFKVPGLKTTTGAEDDAHRTLSARWARKVTGRPGIALAVGVVLMVVLAVPLFGLRLGMTDAGTKPPSSTERQAYDLLASGFGARLQRSPDPGRRPHRQRRQAGDAHPTRRRGARRPRHRQRQPPRSTRPATPPS